MSGGRTVELTLLRFDPSVDREPRYETHPVEYADRMKVLDALRQVFRRRDGSLAFRWACGVGKCGTCTVNLDGRPVLACQHPLPERDVVIEPMPRHPVLVDLVVDRERVVPPPPGRLGDSRRAAAGAETRRVAVRQNDGPSIKGGI